MAGKAEVVPVKRRGERHGEGAALRFREVPLQGLRVRRGHACRRPWRGGGGGALEGGGLTGRGLEAVKEALWAVDEYAGVRYRDPGDPDFVYSEAQGGEVRRLHLPTGEMRDVKPYPGAGEPRYRFNWNTPIASPLASIA